MTEIWCVADGPTCPKIEPTHPIICANYGYKNVIGKPYAITFIDNWFFNNHQGDITEKAETIYAPLRSQIPGAVQFRFANYITKNLSEGVYAGIEGGGSAGIAALSIAILLGAKTVRLFGYDYRTFTEEEQKYYFGRKIGVHASEANHRNKNIEDGLIYLQKIYKFEKFLSTGVKIINHSVHSNIPYFERVPF